MLGFGDKLAAPDGLNNLRHVGLSRAWFVQDLSRLGLQGLPLESFGLTGARSS